MEPSIAASKSPLKQSLHDFSLCGRDSLVSKVLPYSVDMSQDVRVLMAATRKIFDGSD